MLEQSFTKFSEITECNGYYAVQGHSRLPILVPIESSCTTSYCWLILTYFLSCTVTTLWLIIRQIFASHSRAPHFNALAAGTLHNAINDISPKTRFSGLHFRCRKYWCIFNHFYVLCPKTTEFGEITLRLGLLRRSRSSKVTEFGTNRKLICNFLLLINTNLTSILHRFRDIVFDRSKIAIFGYPSCV